MINKDEVNVTLKPIDCDLLTIPSDKFPKNNQEVMDVLAEVLEKRSAYILCEHEQAEHNKLFYVKYHEKNSAKYQQLRGNYHLVPVLTTASFIELIKLFPQDHYKLLSASKGSLNQITELTGHTQIRWLGSDPFPYQEGDDDEHLALASIYSEEPHQDYFKASHHYRCANQSELAYKFIRLAQESNDIRAFKYLGHDASQESNFQEAINCYQLTLEGSYKTEEIQYFCQNAALNELIDIYQRDIEKELLVETFTKLAPKGWPILYAIFGKTYDNQGNYQQAIAYYLLFVEKAKCESNPLNVLVNKYSQMDQSTIHNYFPWLENYHAILRRYVELNKEVDSITKRIEVLKSMQNNREKGSFLEKQKINQGEILQTIRKIKEAYEKIQSTGSFFSFFNDPNFPEKPTLKLIIRLALSENPKLKKVLEQLVYVDAQGNLENGAPEAFKNAYEAYLQENVDEAVQKKEQKTATFGAF